MQNKYIGFLVHTAEMFNHYGPVWEKLGYDVFDIVVCGSEFERERIRTLSEEFGLTHVEVENVIESKYRYPTLVSNHYVAEYKGKPLTHVVGQRNVRFMYALGKARHNFAEWNKFYDMVLCFGPYQADRLAPYSSVVKFQMGYPRYDKYFHGDHNREELLSTLGCDPRKKTIVWLPTWVELSSIDLYASSLALLCSTYNVIVKPHPLSLEREPERIERLVKLPFTAVITSIFDNLYLYMVADYVFCDYGGTAFGALYLDKKLLLLNMPNAEKDSLTGEDSADIHLRQDIVNVDPHQAHRIKGILDNVELWEEQKQVRRRLRGTYFAPTYGFSADMAALAIANAETILEAY